MDGTRLINNPNRVPPTLTAIDGPQEGEPRVIHPITMLVGTVSRETAPMDSTNPELYEVKEEGTYTNENGDPFYFPAGHKLPHAVANHFPDFATKGDEVYVAGSSNVRQEEAPANRMETPPDNRQVVTSPTAKPTKKADAQKDGDA
ncbi:MAG: hypothetical protein M3440_09140 [Chloroflexota bacterium]|nr:hypothetical protein [Chloroflexota bacterium]